MKLKNPERFDKAAADAIRQQHEIHLKVERQMAIKDAEHRVAEAALRAWEPATFAMISLAYKSKGPKEWREFTDALDDLRRLKGEG